MNYLLDTDTLIFMIRGLKSSQPKAANRRQAMRVVKRCRQAQDKGDSVGLSVITVCELEFGARKSDHYDSQIEAVRKVLLPFDIHDYDAVECPLQYGRMRHQLEKHGSPIGSLDMLIAAHALSLSATLVTNNQEHFSRVDGLKTANWAV